MTPFLRFFLKNGELIEIGTPTELLDNKNGHFYSMVAEGGIDFLQKMKFLARNKDFDPNT